MIIFDKNKMSMNYEYLSDSTGNTNDIDVGVVGNNLSDTNDFLIVNKDCRGMDFLIHLSFSDGRKNTVTPELVEQKDNYTALRWIVKENDTFSSGYLELQIEGKKESGESFRTIPILMFADRNISMSDDTEYLPPVYNTSELEKRIDELSTQLDAKADKGSFYKKAELDARLSNKLDNIKGSVKTGNLENGAVTEAKLSEAVQRKLNSGGVAPIDYINEYIGDITATDISDNSTDEQLASAKAVYDLFASIVNGNEVSY